MDSDCFKCADGTQRFAVRDLLEDIAQQIDNLRTGLESLEGIAEELVSNPTAVIRRDILMRLQLMDSFYQQIAALPPLVRSLKSSVPGDLAIEDADARDAFSAARSTHQGTTTTGQPEAFGTVGDCELWNS